MHLDTSTDPQVGYRPPGTLDVASALQPYAGRWTARQAAHLLRRAGFGGTPAEIASATASGMSRAVDTLLHPGPDADVADYPPAEALFGKDKRGVAQRFWLDRMLRTKRPLVEKMTLFWHGHFATSLGKVEPSMLLGQIALFRAQGLSRFPALLSAVTRDPAMLVWLDNRANVKGRPNENYAREVMELFALGLGTYTEDDIHEAARAFTGWTVDKNYVAQYVPARHDDGIKTILGHTGSFGADDAIAVIVAQPVHQRFIAHKLLEFFLYSDPEPELIEATAQVYAVSGYDIARTVGTIVRSNVFYSPRAYRALPKSPIEYAVGTLRYLGITAVPPNLVYQLARMGQEPLNPPSVKGWDGGPSWVTTTAMLARFNFTNQLLAQKTSANPDAVVQAAGGIDANRVVQTVVRDALQDDVTADVRAALVDYLNGTRTPTGELQLPFGPENYQEKIRGAIALTLNLPVNQLD